MTSDEVPTVDGRYVHERTLATSPVTEVWLAHDDVAGRPVVLKLYRGASATDATWREAFARRARAVGTLSHPGIATSYDFGGSDDAWLVSAYVRDAAPVDAALAPTPSGALDIVGQTAMALAAAHDAGVAHGALTADHVLVRPDGSGGSGGSDGSGGSGSLAVTLSGFSMSEPATVDADLAALRALAHDLLRDASVDTGVAAFLAALDRDSADATAIGRSALALAAASTGGVPVVAAASPRQDEPYDDGEQIRVRNRLIALGVIVVVFGAALLWFVNRGSSESTVPSVVDLPLSQAQNQLIESGFRGETTTTSGSGNAGSTVTSQSPVGGTQAKDGSTVTLTVSGGAGS